MTVKQVHTNQIFLPRQGTSNEYDEVEIPDSLVILGANGSGKSRFGSWVELNNQAKRRAKRISAQRTLSVPDYAEIKIYEKAFNELIENFRTDEVWSVLSDYPHVLSTLFASTSQRDSEYVKISREAQGSLTPPVPDSPIDKLIKIWNSVLPHRTIKLENNKVDVSSPDGQSYSGKFMSDGERVALYLISQCLLLPANAMVVIDEPELHLHKALMSRLWNTLEEERQDCLFVYITHDLDFAASRVKATKIWVKSYNAIGWEWEFVPDINEVPESLLLQIIGSRKPILFVEGEKGSYDHAIYQAFYPDFTIIPRGGCEKVIESTKGINDSAALSSIKAYGLVDRDYRSQEETNFLLTKDVFTADVAEVENILLTPKIIQVIANHFALDPSETTYKIADLIINSFESHLEREVSFRTSLEVNYMLNTLDQKREGADNIKQAISDVVSKIDVDAIYSKNEALLREIIANRDFEKALKFSTNKGLLPNASRFFGMQGHEYAKLVLRLLKTDKKADIISALEPYLPTIAHS